jgi:hypothetical protein
MLHHLNLYVPLLGVLFSRICDAAPVAADNVIGPSDDPSLYTNVVEEKNHIFVLAGDSTTATNGGWGDGFIQTLRAPNRGTNLGKSGATTVSFKGSGNWNKVIAEVNSYKNGGPSARQDAQAEKHFFVLAGDSTTAKQSDGGGGWGDGFLRTLQSPSGGTNFGHNGATTVSFRSGGDWGKVISEVKKNGGAAYVTIQVSELLGRVMSSIIKPPRD